MFRLFPSFRRSQPPFRDFSVDAELNLQILAGLVERLTVGEAARRHVVHPDGMATGWFEEATQDFRNWYKTHDGDNHQLWTFDIGCARGLALVEADHVVSLYNYVHVLPAELTVTRSN